MHFIHPILPHTMDELYSYFSTEVESVHLLDMTKKVDHIDEELLSEYEGLLKLRSDVLKALENARASGLIGSSQEANVNLYIKDAAIRKYYQVLPNIEKTRLFIVSKVIDDNTADNKDEFSVSYVKITKNEGIKCERCWNRFEEVEVNENHVCHRCVEAMEHYETKVN
jgi:isoleucyl-tRNA synthetase